MRTVLLASAAAVAAFVTSSAARAATIGGVDLGNLPNYLFVFADGSTDANWQGASKGFVGDVAVDGLSADERTSGGVPYAGTIYTNDVTLGAWQGIVNQNQSPVQAWGSTGQTARISALESSLTSAFSQINGLTATAGYTARTASSLNNLNTQNSVNETFVINVTSFNTTGLINITGDAGDVFIIRWDTNTSSAGYQGQVKFQSGGGINPLGGLTPGNFINVAGDIASSGGGSNPSGLATYLAEIPAIDGGSAVNGGGFYTGYWLTTGDSDGDTSSLSNAIFVGGWYTLTDKFSMTSGTSGVNVDPVPEPAALALLTLTTLSMLVRRERRA